MEWQDEAMRLWRANKDKPRLWPVIGEALTKFFPGEDARLLGERARKHIRGTDEYKAVQKKPEEQVTPEGLMRQYNIDSSKWQIASFRPQSSSKITLKPRGNNLLLSEIDQHFEELDRQFETPKPTRVTGGSCMAEVNLADLHLGKLCWRGDTMNNFDYKIAKQIYYYILSDVCNQLQHKPLEYITFVWANDFFNSDTISKTTTAGTMQDTDVRWSKLFNVGVEMLVEGIEMLSQIAPVKTFYTASNHDEVTGYHALKYLQAWFRNNPNVEVNTGAQSRKYMLFGNTLLGFTHGDREKPRSLAMLMPIEVPELWSQARFREMHTAHLHSEHMIEETNGVIIRRISSPTATDTWHYESGYVGAVRKAQTFIYDRTDGLVQIINTPVKEVEK